MVQPAHFGMDIQAPTFKDCAQDAKRRIQALMFLLVAKTGNSLNITRANGECIGLDKVIFIFFKRMKCMFYDPEAALIK